MLAISLPVRADEWRSIGPDSHAGGDIVGDPAAPGHLYIRNQTGALFKSRDGGLTWSQLLNGLPRSSILDFSVSSSRRVGRYAAPVAVYAATSSRIFRSYDGGESWRELTPLSGISEIAVDPSDSQIVYVRVTQGFSIDHILKSVDGGITWQSTGSASVPINCGQEGFCSSRFNDLVVDPSNPSVIHAGPYRSLDGGASWHLLGPAPTNPFGFPYVRNWAFTEQAHYRVRNGIEVSRDAGGTWLPFATVAPFGQEPFLVRADLLNRVVYAITGDGSFHTEDGGLTWVREPAAPSPAAVVDPLVPSTLYLGTMWKSTDYGRTWTVLPGSGLRGTTNAETIPFVAPSRPQTIYAVSRFQPLNVSTDGGASWTQRSLPTDFRVRSVAVDYTDDRIVYALNNDSGTMLLRSFNRGTTWTAIDANLPCGALNSSRALAAGPLTGTLFFSGWHVNDGSPVCFGVLQSTDFGATWRSVSTLNVTAIVTHPTDPAIVFLVGARPSQFLVPPVLQRSVDGGSSFQTIPDAPPLTSVVIDGVTAGLMYGAADRTVYKSVDNGDSWQQVGNLLPGPVNGPHGDHDGLAALAVDTMSGHIFVTAGSTLMLRPGETSWVDLLAPQITWLSLAPGAGLTLFGGTTESGIWRVHPTAPTPTLSLTANSGSSAVTGSVPAGSTVFLDAVSTGVTNPVYRFSRWDPGIGWHVVQDYSPLQAYSWTPGLTDSGAHLFQAVVHATGNASDTAVASLPMFTVTVESPALPPSNLVARSAPQDLRHLLIDHNADGIKDLFVHNRASGEWAIYLAAPDGTFTTGISGGWAPGWHISVADFNGDLFTDFFLYSRDSGVFYKVINTGSGFQYFTQGWRPGFDIHILDFNGDHKSDVFVINPVDGVWYTCISIGDGTQGFEYTSGAWAPMWQFHGADFNADGRSDLFLYSRDWGIYYKVIWQPHGGFAYQVGQGPSAMNPTLLDLNGDGRSDVVFYDKASGAFQRCSSTGDGTAGFDCDSGGWSPGFSVHAAAFDADARGDLFLHQASTGLWYKVLNYATGFAYETGGWAQWSITVDDLDGDGLSDVLLISGSNGVYYKALTRWPGTFAYSTGLLQ